MIEAGEFPRSSAPVPGLVECLDEITGVGTRNAQVIIAELEQPAQPLVTQHGQLDVLGQIRPDSPAIRR